MIINSVRNLKNLKNKTVFLRVDFNVPISQGKIKEDYKIKVGLETIKYLVARGARLIIATHLGEPTKKFEAAYSVRPVAARLRTLLKKPVKFLGAALGPKIAETIKKMPSGSIVCLENLRFNPGEYDNDDSFAKTLASLADIYVNDAFAVCHRQQASVVAIKKYLPSYAGCLLEKEVEALYKIIKPKKPLVIILGGTKINTKAPLISKLYPVASQILLGGALANSFFKFQGLEVGKSLIDSDLLIYGDGAKELKKFFQGKKVNSKFILPQDVVIKTKKGEVRVVSPTEVKATDCILDIGPATISTYASYIRQAQTLIWNGPLGKFEEPSFKNGTLIIASLIAARSSGHAYGVVGGGETIAALKLTKMAEYVDWISTAGGAMLTYLGGGKMPGLSKIIKK